MLDDSLHLPYELTSQYGIELLGNIWETKREEKRGLRAIRYRQCIEKNSALEIAISNIKCYCMQHQIKKLFVVTSVEKERQSNELQIVLEKIKSEIAECIIEENLLLDAYGLEKLLNADAILFVEQIEKTRLKDFEILFRKAKKLECNIIGGVVC